MSRQVPPPGEDHAKIGSRRSRALRSVRTQLLLTVGLVLMVGLAAIVILDYRNEQADRLRQKRVALQEEAQILLPAVRRLAASGPQAVQDYIDVACGRMQETTSPGHHIAVRLGDVVLQAHSHGRASPEMLQAMQRAAGNPSHQARVENESLLVGSDYADEIEVHVSEYVSNVLAASRQHLLWRSVQTAVLGLVAVLATGLVLVRVVTRPIQRLVSTVRRIGKGEVGIKAAPFGSAELQFLADEVNLMSEALADADASRHRELDKARRIQENLLPSGAVPAGWRIVPVFRPADAVGGDFYDFVMTPQGRLIVCIADVTGHGIPAALGAAMLKVLFDAAVRESDHPGEILGFINGGFTSISLAEQFASMAVVTIDPAQHRLQWASAGHEAGYLYRNGEPARSLDSTGLPIGIDSSNGWDTAEHDLHPGDRLILVTDGWAEAFSQTGQVLGRELMGVLLDETRTEPAERAAQHLLDRLGAWSEGGPQSDDMTLLVLEWQQDAPGVVPAEFAVPSPERAHVRA